MEIIIEQRHRVTIVRPTGFVDAVTASTLAEALNGQLLAGDLSLVVDLDQLDYMSSAGLRVLLAVFEDHAPAGGRPAPGERKSRSAPGPGDERLRHAPANLPTLAEAVDSYEATGA